MEKTKDNLLQNIDIDSLLLAIPPKLEKMKNRWKEHTAKKVLEKLEAMIKEGYARDIKQVCDDLSISDWWSEGQKLTITNMKQMRAFLREAIKLGYTGHVCFKVGAHGCARERDARTCDCTNGMWAYKEADKVDPYFSDRIYRSFNPDYTFWSFVKNGEPFPVNTHEKDKYISLYDSLKTAKMLEEALAKA